MTWYIRVKTQDHGHYVAAVIAESLGLAREVAIKQVREKYVPNLAWADTDVLDPLPLTMKEGDL